MSDAIRPAVASSVAVPSGQGALAPGWAERVTPNSPVAAAARVQPNRLIAGGQIERRPLAFNFDGKQYQGFAGDTLASALIANGVKLVGRSFKYHRPRGIMTAGPEEPNALVELREGARREPNTRATVVELFDGLTAASQNRWPSLRFDFLAINSMAAPILGAGFYYKTFMWPAAFWEKVYEPAIRKAAGLGRAAEAPDPDLYEKCTAFCDVLVIGAGPAGLLAALAAGRSGARVMLVQEDFALGGRLLNEQREIGGQSGPGFTASVEAELASLPEVRILRRTSVVGVYDGGTYAAVERVNDHVAVPPAHEPRQRLWRIVAKRAILAGGAIERPIVFPDNDRPGIMLAGAVRTYLHRFAVKPGSRAVIFGNNDDALRTARELHDAGIELAAVVDPRPDALVSLEVLSRETGARLIEGVVSRALGTRALEGVEIRDASGHTLTLPCDLLAVSGGWQPTVHLTSHLGGRPEWAPSLAAFVPGTLPPGMSVIGAARGDFALAACLADGIRAGCEAASDCGFHPKSVTIPSADAESTAVTPLWRVKSPRGKAFVDFQNDVSASDIEIARAEGFRAVEHLKRYTTLGMATDQGKTSNVNGLALMAELTGQTVAATGTTRFRPPYTPVAIGALAGHHKGKHLKPTRLTAGHAWAAREGAVFMETGLWLRAQYFPKVGDKGWRDACDREVAAVRERVGLCDVSTLGKIEVVGRDAAPFLDRLYTNMMSTLPVGRARYGVMLREDGFVMDDGTVARLGEERYVLSTTTANAVKVMSHMDFAAQVLWPDLEVSFASVTEHWAQYAVAGPKARATLAAVLGQEFDLSNAAFPFMAASAVPLRDGTSARLFRISFSGELAYELAVPADLGDSVLRALMAAGAPHGIAPYGIEALNVLRIEKGHAAGGELNGQTTAANLGLGRMMSTKKDFIGAAMAGRPALIDPERPVLVGLKPVNPQNPVGAGAHLLRPGAENKARNDEGYVTSSCWSPTLKSVIALGLLRRGPQRFGEQVRAYDPVRGRDTLVEVCAPVFHDPEGARLRG